MYGNAMKCDMCNHTEFISPGDAILIDDLTVPPGWIRVYANKPHRYIWDTTSTLSNIEAGYDCCSTMCARSALGEHEDNIMQRNEEIQALRAEMAASE